MTNFRLTEFHKGLAILVVAGFMFIAAGWFLAIQPVTVKIRTAKQLIQEAQERSALISEIQDLKIKDRAALGSLAPESDRHLLLGKLTTMANTSGLNVESFTPKSEGAGQYTKLTIDASVQGSFHSLLQFFEALEKFQTPVSLASFEVNTGSFWGDHGSEGWLEVHFTLETYLRGKRSGVGGSP